MQSGLEAMADLRIDGDGSPARCLFDFDLAGGGSDRIGLESLGGDAAIERWLVDGPVTGGEHDGIAWRQAGPWLALDLAVPDAPDSDLAGVARNAYQRLLSLARERGRPWLLRAWNFMPAINAGRGDEERYRRFCLGRGQALEAAGVAEARLCAGTAIGNHESVFRVQALTGVAPGLPIENPRQVSAYRYPRIYGPRSPSFARATVLPRTGGGHVLMLSGTASVVGHATRHAGDLDAQLDEIVRNVEAVLAEAARRLDQPGLARFNRHSRMRVYLRHADDWPAAEAFLRRAWPGLSLVGLHGDICRGDLLVEVEAVHRAPEE